MVELKTSERDFRPCGSLCASAADHTSPQALSRAWQVLCDRYLPIVPDVSGWRYNRTPYSGDLEQGWKLHISATILNAHCVVERVAPLLTDCGVQFKAPASLQELGRLNAGLGKGYSQVGKIITVYPRTNAEAMSLASKLHELTEGWPAPVVPFDLRFRPGSNVYYRYGAFKHLEIENPDGTRTPALRNPQGNMVPDLRELEEAKPAWVDDLFTHQRREQEAPPERNPLKTTYRVFRALSQRGKGGVYQAVDLSVPPPRFCLLKEGRRHGEVSWDGRDGHWRVKHEEQVLTLLSDSGVAVPQIYASFELNGHSYLVTEFIAGESLQALINRQQRRLSVSRALHYGIEIASVISDIQAAGWVWRDCKPANLMITGQGRIRPLDFEGACRIDQPDLLPWGTPGFAPSPERTAHEARSSVYDDLYALGAVIYLLLTGRLPDAVAPIPIAKLRRDVPIDVQEVITELLTASPRQRPGVERVIRQLKSSLPRTEVSVPAA